MLSSTRTTAISTAVRSRRSVPMMEQFVPVELDDVLVASQINNVRFSSLRSQSVRISLGTTAPSETCDKKIASILLRLCEIIVGSRLS